MPTRPDVSLPANLRPRTPAALRQALRKRFGIWVLYEARNKVLLGPRALAMRRFETREVARLTDPSTHVPTAQVAVIIPTYRRPELLLRAVRSALDQDFQDLVVVVVSDGAGETVPALPDDRRLTSVVLSRNTGVLGLVRNVGIRMTASRYVAFLDDDNCWLPSHISSAVSKLQQGYDVVYTGVRRVDAEGRTVDRLSVPFDRRRLAEEAYVDANSIVVRRDRAGLFSRIHRTKAVLPSEDWEFVRRLSRRRRVGHVPEETVEYYINPQSHYSDWSTSGLVDEGPHVAP